MVWRSSPVRACGKSPQNSAEARPWTTHSGALDHRTLTSFIIESHGTCFTIPAEFLRRRP